MIVIGNRTEACCCFGAVFAAEFAEVITVVGGCWFEARETDSFHLGILELTDSNVISGTLFY